MLSEQAKDLILMIKTGGNTTLLLLNLRFDQQQDKRPFWDDTLLKQAARL